MKKGGFKTLREIKTSRDRWLLANTSIIFLEIE
jgi:hypothetical protein